MMKVELLLITMLPMYQPNTDLKNANYSYHFLFTVRTS